MCSCVLVLVRCCSLPFVAAQRRSKRSPENILLLLVLVRIEDGFAGVVAAAVGAFVALYVSK